MECYIKLTDGAGVNDAMNEMLYANNVNTVNSTIKTTIDNWYEQNLLAYSYMLEDVILCNNRTIINSSENVWNPNGGNLRTAIVFKSSSVSGDLSCSNDTDKFSISNNKAKLTYPIGLPSSEEMSLLENKLLLYIGENYWLASRLLFLMNIMLFM